MQQPPDDSGGNDPSRFVEMDAVDLRYGGPDGTLALDGTTLSVARGEFAAVVGPSGCGKSSLMKLVTGLLPCTGGSIRVAGTKVNGPLKIVGMAFQNPTLLPWRNTLLNTMLPLEIVRPHRHRLRRHRREIRRASQGAPGGGRARRLRGHAALDAVGRHAAAREPVPSADPRARAADAGRALRRARCLHARGVVGRASDALAGAQVHLRAGDPRPARGRLSCRRHLRHERAARAASFPPIASTCRGLAAWKAHSTRNSSISCTPSAARFRGCAAKQASRARPKVA